MTQSELEKIANANPEVKKALTIFTEHLEKKADEGTYFNETVPTQGSETVPPAEPGAAQTPVQPQPPQVPPVAGMPPEAAAVPQEQGLNPSEEAAVAAQAFLAPVFAAAAQGDPSAQSVIAKAAGEVAKGVAAAAAESMGGAQAPIMPAAPIPTPEEEVANRMVPPKKNDDQQKEEAEEGKTNGAPPKANNEGPEKISMDLNTVGMLLRMSKEGKL